MNIELQAQLLQYKAKDNFPPENWGQRGLNFSPEEVRQNMNKAVTDFVDYLDNLLQQQTPSGDYKAHIQDYFNDWDSFDFDTEEAEFIVDVKSEIMKLLGVNCRDILI